MEQIVRHGPVQPDQKLEQQRLRQQLPPEGILPLGMFQRGKLRAACPVRRMNDEAEFLPRPVKTGRKVTAAARAAQKLRREIEDAPLIGRVRPSLRPVNAALRYEHKIPGWSRYCLPSTP